MQLLIFFYSFLFGVEVAAVPLVLIFSSSDKSLFLLPNN